MPLDVVLAVVSLPDGPMPGFWEMLVSARTAGHAQKLIVFFNKAEFVDDEDLRKLVQDEVRLLATSQAFWNPNDITMIVGSAETALRNADDPIDTACIDSILRVLDGCTVTAEGKILA